MVQSFLYLSLQCHHFYLHIDYLVNLIDVEVVKSVKVPRLRPIHRKFLLPLIVEDEIGIITLGEGDVSTELALDNEVILMMDVVYKRPDIHQNRLIA